MTTKISDAQIQAYLDGQLGDKGEAEVLAHLERNPELLARVQKDIDEKHHLAEEIDDAVDDEVDPETAALAEKLASRIEAKERRHNLKRWSSLGASALVVAAIGWFGHVAFVDSGQSALPPFVADAARDHQIFARSVKPIEIPGSDLANMEELFSSHLGETVQIPNLLPIGYSLVGGRLLGAEEGPFVQILYDNDDDHRLSVYLAKRGSSTVKKLQVVEVSGLGTGYWDTDALSYALVAETTLEDVQEIAATLAQSN